MKQFSLILFFIGLFFPPLGYASQRSAYAGQEGLMEEAVFYSGVLPRSSQVAKKARPLSFWSILALVLAGVGLLLSLLFFYYVVVFLATIGFLEGLLIQAFLFFDYAAIAAGIALFLGLMGLIFYDKDTAPEMEKRMLITTFVIAMHVLLLRLIFLI
ncbi:MAG: hypothetical protein AAF206_06355 [Bacteroidota bacterium]